MHFILIFCNAFYIYICPIFCHLIAVYVFVYFTCLIPFKMSKTTTTTTRAMLFDMDGTLLGTLFFCRSSGYAKLTDNSKSL